MRKSGETRRETNDKRIFAHSHRHDTQSRGAEESSLLKILKLASINRSEVSTLFFKIHFTRHQTADHANKCGLTTLKFRSVKTRKFGASDFLKSIAI